MASSAEILALCVKQSGKPYIFGHEVKLTDPNPDAFDCSELFQWAAARVGTSLPDGAINQYAFIKARGLALPVSKALRVPGALLFKEGEGRHARIYHVGMSMGDGSRICEAKGRAYGVGIFPVGSWADSPAQGLNRWNLAGLIPGINYGASGVSGSLLFWLGLIGASFYI